MSVLVGGTVFELLIRHAFGVFESKEFWMMVADSADPVTLKRGRKSLAEVGLMR